MAALRLNIPCWYCHSENTRVAAGPRDMKRANPDEVLHHVRRLIECDECGKTFWYNIIINPHAGINRRAVNYRR